MGFEFDVFFEFEFLFEGLEGVVGIAACEREPLARLLTEAGWHFFVRKCSEFTERGDAPERECLVVIEFKMEGADGDGCERCGFATSWNYGDAAGEFGFDAGCVEVVADGDGGTKAGCGNCVAKLMGDLLGRSEETLGAGDVENERTGVIGEDFFDARRELRQGFKKNGSGCGLGIGGSNEDWNVAELFDFEAGEAGDDSAFSRVGVESADALLWGRAVEDDGGSGLQIGPEAQDGLGGKFGYMHGGIEVRMFCVGAHACFSASQAV